MIDAEDSETLIGATVVCGESYAVTNSDGYWSLNLARGRNTLQCDYLGYSGKELTIDLRCDTVIVISLSKDAVIQESAVYADSPSGLELGSMGALSMSTELLNRLPAVLGGQDVLKALQHLPGVHGAVDGTSDIMVRGGDKDENLFLMDGVPVYNTSHLFGFLSSFAPESVKKATLYKGNFPARFGGKASSVVDIRMMDGNAAKTCGSVRIGMLNDAISVNGPIVRDKLVYAVNLRGIHTAPIAPILKAVRAPLSYGFYDFNAKLTYRSLSDRISLTAYRGADDFHYSGTEYEGLDGPKRYIGRQDFGIKWSNSLAALRWNHSYGSGLYSDMSLSASFYSPNSRFGLREEYIDGVHQKYSDYVSRLTDIRFRYSVDGAAGTAGTFSSGVEAAYYIVAPGIIGTSVIDGESESSSVLEDGRTLASAAFYAEGEFVFGRFRLEPGIRLSFDAVDGMVHFSPEPRFTMEYTIPGTFALRAGYTRVSQVLHCLTTSSLSMPTDLWVPVTGRIKPVSADHASLAAIVNFPHNLELTLEVFGKYRRNILAYRDGVSFLGSSENWEDMVSVGLGRSVGAEIMLRKTAGRLTGAASYSLSWSEKRFPDSQVGSGRWFPDTYDRRHYIDVWAGFKLNESITFDLSWSFAGGAMTTIADFMSVAPMSSGGYNVGFYEYEKNGFRLPPSHHLDVSMTLRRQARHGESVWNFGIYNVYNALNPNLYYVEKPSYGKDKVLLLHKISILPILPSISYTYKF